MFQKRGLSLISMGKGEKCQIVFLKRAKANFAHFYRSFLGPVFFFFSFLIESKRQVAITRLSFIVISCLVGSVKTTLMRVGHYGQKRFTHFGSFREILQIFSGVHLFFFFFFDRIQKIGCYNQTVFYSNFVSCEKRKDDINVCGSLWQKKLYTFWQFQRNSIDLFLGPSFFLLF